MRSIRRLRSALNDSAEEPRYIETLPRHGYPFIAEAEAVPGRSPERSKISAVAGETIRDASQEIGRKVDLNGTNRRGGQGPCSGFSCVAV